MTVQYNIWRSPITRKHWRSLPYTKGLLNVIYRKKMLWWSSVKRENILRVFYRQETFWMSSIDRVSSSADSGLFEDILQMIDLLKFFCREKTFQMSTLDRRTLKIPWPSIDKITFEDFGMFSIDRSFVERHHLEAGFYKQEIWWSFFSFEGRRPFGGFWGSSIDKRSPKSLLWK